MINVSYFEHEETARSFAGDRPGARLYGPDTVLSVFRHDSEDEGESCFADARTQLWVVVWTT